MITEDEVFLFGENVFSVFKQSNWSSALTLHQVDVLEVLRGSILMLIVNVSRGEKPNSIKGVNLNWKYQLLFNRIKHQVHGWRENGNAKRKSAKLVPSSIVFWPREPTHLNGQIPVSHALREMGVATSFVANQSKIFNLLQAKNTQAVFTRFAWPDLIKAAHQDAQEKRKILRGSPDKVLIDWAIANNAYEQLGQIRELIYESLPYVYEAIITTDAIIDDMSPEVLVVGNDLTLEGRAAALRARVRGCTTACLMHGTAFGRMHGFHITDKFIVYGDRSRRGLENAGTNPSKIAVSGAPYLDSVAGQSGDAHPAIKKLIALDNNQEWILVALSGPGHQISLEHHYKTIENIMYISTRLSHVSFVFKLHRKDRISHYEKVMYSVSGASVHIIPYGASGFPQDIFDWLHGCSIVLTGASTVAIEAMLMNVPVITMDFMHELFDIDFIQSKATCHVENLESLEQCIDMFLKKPEKAACLQKRSNSFLSDYFFVLDDKSSHRAANTIIGLYS